MDRELPFLIFCLESYKVYRNLSGQAVCRLFEEYGVFEYLQEFYDVLHTTGQQYINHDIDVFLVSRGVGLPAQ